MARPPARCLDVTRLISRMGRGPWTGVDRVELAYLRHLSADAVPLYLLARTALGYVLAGPDAARAMLAGFDGARPWGAADLIGRLSWKAHPLKRAAEADLRRHAVGRCRRGRLAAMLARAMPDGASYLNVGHSNLSEEVLCAWAEHRGARVGVLIHDTIPLDFPQYQREGTVKAFEEKFARVMRCASHVIYSTDAARAAADRHRADPQPPPHAIIAPLGVEPVAPDPDAVPGELTLSPPFFVTIGTIEPRKNHALLLDVWEALGADAPPLLIAGRRGWNNRPVFHRLDNAPMMGRTVFEHGDLSDGALAALMQEATALLFPSHAEGFGLPPVEAAAHHLPVLCTDLAVYREVLGDNAVYLPGDDVYAWTQQINELTKAHRAGQKPTAAPFEAPTWTAHFDAVLKVL